MEQIALLEVPLRDITSARTRRLVGTLGEVPVPGGPCKVEGDGRHLEFRIGTRRFEIDLECLVLLAGKAIEAQLRTEILHGAVPAQDDVPPANPRR